ncbi:MAG: helix-turn-helix transcriptional regulator [Spirochaetia bacterium]|jgi:DNA-binding XRE family transcriptional regulator|nr:helix-turn-helix transcriptional regulator [Spirochaetia bacterium]MCH3918302.1 helix-turn-helix transcriptional regulator [Spirochaetia bacterium]
MHHQENGTLSYAKAIEELSTFASMSPSNLAALAKIGQTTLLYAEDNWNPKFLTIRKLCRAVQILPHAFFALAGGKAVNLEQERLQYLAQKNPEIHRFGTFVRQQRKKKGLSQSALAKKACLSPQTIYRNEQRDSIDELPMITLILWVTALDTSIEEFCLKYESYTLGTSLTLVTA